MNTVSLRNKIGKMKKTRRTVVCMVIGHHLAIPMYVYWVIKYGRKGALKHVQEILIKYGADR